VFGSRNGVVPEAEDIIDYTLKKENVAERLAKRFGAPPRSIARQRQSARDEVGIGRSGVRPQCAARLT
jgi:hypothetical protein